MRFNLFLHTPFSGRLQKLPAFGLALLFALLSFVFRAQGDVKQHLIVVHVEPSTGPQFRQQIFSYHFLNGSFTGRDELMTVVGKREGKDYIRTDLGANVLYKQRYLITAIGNILDLNEKKVLLDERATLVRAANDSAIFYTNDVYLGKFYSVYDFKTNQYGPVKDLLFKPRPDQDVEFDKSTAPFRLYYYPADKPKVLLDADAGYGQQGTGETHVPDPPLIWITPSEFIYCSFNKENTELSIYKAGLKAGQKKLIGKVAIQREKQLADIHKLDHNELVLQLGMKQVFIDLDGEKVRDMAFTPPDHGFSFACADGAAGRQVKLDGKDLGSFHFRPAFFKADTKIAALVKEVGVGAETYQQGISVWNVNSGSWGNVDSEDVLSLIGWINE